jgi:CHAT domain-containing protein/Tfp pilus assembly protein PilF
MRTGVAFALALVLPALILCSNARLAAQDSGAPAESESMIHRGMRLIDAGKYAEAIEVMTPAAEAQDFETSRMARSLLGYCGYRAGKPEQAILWWERALEKDPKFLWVLERLQAVYFQDRNDYGRGKSIALRAQALCSGKPGVYYNLARSCALEGDAEAALRFIDKAVYFGYTDFARISTERDFRAISTVEPFATLPAHLDSIEAAAEALTRGSKCRDSGDVDQAAALYQKARRCYEEALGRDCLADALVEGALGMLSSSQHRHEETVAHYRRSLEIRAMHLGAVHTEVAVVWENLGRLLRSLCRYPLAIDSYRKALAILERLRGPDDVDLARVCNGLSIALDKNGDYTEAIEVNRRTLDAALRARGPDHPSVATRYFNLGTALDNNGEYDEALSCFQKGLEITLKTSGPDDPGCADFYNGMGLTLRHGGHDDSAIELYMKALAIQERALGLSHRDVADTYNNLGAAYGEKGEHEQAIGYYEKALAIRRVALDPEDPDVAACYNNLGIEYDSSGDADRAILYFQEALDNRVATLGADHPDVADSWNGLAAAHPRRGDFAKAVDDYLKAIGIWSTRLGPEHARVATGLSNLGLAYADSGRTDQAVDCFQKALAIQLKVLAPAHPDVARTLDNLGTVHHSRGECDLAAGCYHKALEIARASDNRETTILAARNLGILLLERGRPAEARRAFQEGVRVIERARGETGAGKREFAARNISLYYLSLQACADMRDPDGVFEAAEAARARGFLDRLSLSAALAADGVSAEQREQMLALNDQVETLAAQRSAEIARRGGVQDSPGLLAVVNELQQKEKELAQADQSLAAANDRYRALRRPILATLSEAREMLAVDEAILEYVLSEGGQDDEPQAWCLLIRSAAVDLVPLDERFNYTRAVTGFREAILNGTGDRRERGEELYRKLFQPVEGRLGGVEKLIIVPDGALAFLPFDALTAGGRSPYLAERFEMSLAPSISVLKMVGDRRPEARAGQLLALGGARYSGDGSHAQRGRTALRRGGVEKRVQEQAAGHGAARYYHALGLQWDDLPGTREEVLAIRDEVFGGGGTTVLQGDEASEKSVKRLSASGELERERLVHFATHGLFDAEFPAYSAVVLSEVSGALKGSSAEDGYLTVEEVALLRLKADLVVLSACETGLGKVVEGDGVVGLTRAFLVSGARGAEVTLWVVDDTATKQFMVRVYLLAERSRAGFAAAMTKAKREFIASKEFSDPYYWSGFVLYGR